MGEYSVECGSPFQVKTTRFSLSSLLITAGVWCFTWGIDFFREMRQIADDNVMR
jgi:hypothetical protein